LHFFLRCRRKTTLVTFLTFGPLLFFARGCHTDEVTVKTGTLFKKKFKIQFLWSVALFLENKDLAYFARKINSSHNCFDRKNFFLSFYFSFRSELKLRVIRTKAASSFGWDMKQPRVHKWHCNHNYMLFKACNSWCGLNTTTKRVLNQVKAE
jgi:hypothetical protein